jgi:hypothetical protein
MVEDGKSTGRPVGAPGLQLRRLPLFVGRVPSHGAPHFVLRLNPRSRTPGGGTGPTIAAACPLAMGGSNRGIWAQDVLEFGRSNARPLKLFMLDDLLIPLFGLVTTALVVGSILIWAKLQSRKNLRRPVREKLLRSPGEHLRSQIEGVDENLMLAVAGVCFTPMIFWLFLTRHLGPKPSAPTLLVLLAIIALGFLIGAAVVLARLIRERANLHLGFSGERAVGEELNQLMLDGYHVFHDVVFDDQFNIDHVVVGPSGVYAIETKTRRKGKLAPGTKMKRHELIFDGDTVHFPCGWKDRDNLEQTRRNAKSLSKFLTAVTRARVDASGILTYPGWFVERKGKGDVKVLNHLEIKSCVVRPGPAVLSEERVQQIADQLDQKCRTVEF